MKTTTIGELFTERQLSQAAAIMHNCPIPHKDLVQMLSKTWNNPEVLVEYAAYLLEAHRSGIVSEYAT